MSPLLPKHATLICSFLLSLCRFLTDPAIASLVSPFILSRFVDCNSLLFGSTCDMTLRLHSKIN